MQLEGVFFFIKKTGNCFCMELIMKKVFCVVKFGKLAGWQVGQHYTKNAGQEVVSRGLVFSIMVEMKSFILHENIATGANSIGLLTQVKLEVHQLM